MSSFTDLQAFMWGLFTSLALKMSDMSWPFYLQRANGYFLGNCQQLGVTIIAINRFVAIVKPTRVAKVSSNRVALQYYRTVLYVHIALQFTHLHTYRTATYAYTIQLSVVTILFSGSVTET